MPSELSGIDCPSCGAHLEASAEALLPEQTDMTLSLQITEGQLMQLETLGGVLTNFADLQKEVGKSLGVNVTVLLAGLQYENNRIDITARICNAISDRLESAPELPLPPRPQHKKEEADAE